MMNCFEARQDFVRFWQSALDGERRRDLLAHLKGCSKCDRAFRAFALTAPMLHSGSAAAAWSAVRPASEGRSDAMPEEFSPQEVGHPDLAFDVNGLRSADARRAAEILRRASVYRLADRRPLRPWRDAAAGLSAVAAAVLLLYFSLATPSQSFDDLLATPDSISEAATQPDTDFLGQQMAPIPAVSNDIAG
jgi:hypothetical protein